VEEPGDVEFAQWAVTAGLTSSTIVTLAQNDCADLGALVLLNDEHIKSLGLTVGQQARISHAISRLKPKTEPSGPSTTTSIHQHKLHSYSIPAPNGNAPLDVLLAQTCLKDNSGSNDGHVAQVPAYMRPEMYLRTSRAGEANSKHLDIVDYVSRYSFRTEEEVIASGAGTKIVVKAGPSKPKLDTVSPTQWIASNARIMAELLSTGNLTLACVSQYLAYTCKVGDLAERYDWKSVLLFDREYRMIQAAHHIPWGTDIPHLVTTSLKEKSPPPLSADKYIRQPAKTWQPRGNNQGSYRAPGNQREICKLFNRGRCPYANCKFDHVCSVPGCGKDHCEVEHQKFA
jgi:hypothetical protein